MSAGTGVAWRDDSHITEVSAHKRYALANEQSGVTIEVVV